MLIRSSVVSQSYKEKEFVFYYAIIKNRNVIDNSENNYYFGTFHAVNTVFE